MLFVLIVTELEPTSEINRDIKIFKLINHFNDLLKSSIIKYG